MLCVGLSVDGCTSDKCNCSWHLIGNATLWKGRTCHRSRPYVSGRRQLLIFSTSINSSAVSLWLLWSLSTQFTPFPPGFKLCPIWTRGSASSVHEIKFSSSPQLISNSHSFWLTRKSSAIFTLLLTSYRTVCIVQMKTYGLILCE